LLRFAANFASALPSLSLVLFVSPISSLRERGGEEDKELLSTRWVFLAYFEEGACMAAH